MNYTLSQREDGSVITVYVPGHHGALVADSDHPNFKAIVGAAVLAEQGAVSDDEVLELFDTAATIAKHFEKLTDRISVYNHRIYLDGDEVHDSLTDHIIRCMDTGEANWMALVKFMERIQSNPNEHSRTQLYDWLAAHAFTITVDGLIVGYKGCQRNSEGILESTTSGTAIVNGETITGYIPNPIGAVVEMPRSQVAHDPGAACSSGLHVGTHSYAQQYARSGALLEVHVDPRDVVSVPTDAAGEKVRVCRYTVVGEIELGYTVPVLSSQEALSDHDASNWEDDYEDDGEDGYAPYDDVNTEEIGEAAVAPLPLNPTSDQFIVMQQRAKRRHRNFTKYATKQGPWTLIGDDPDQRESWSVNQ